MVGIEHPKVIRVVRHLIVADVIYPEEEDEDIAVDDYGSASDEQDESGLLEAGVIKGATGSVTKEV